MRLIAAPGDIARALQRINPHAPAARRQEKGEGVRIQADPEGGLRVCSPEWRTAAAPRPAAETQVAASVEEGGGFRLADSRRALQEIKTRFRGAAGREPVRVETTDGTLRLGGAALEGEEAHPWALAGRPEEEMRFDWGSSRHVWERLFRLCGDDYDRPRLTRIQVRPGRETVRLGATDLFRLAVENLPVTRSPASERSVERELVRCALRVRGAEGEARAGWSAGGRAYFAVGGVRFGMSDHSRLTGNGPDLDELLSLKWARGDAVVRDPHGVARRIEDVPPPRGESPNDVPIRIRWRGGRMEAGYGDLRPVTVGEVEWEGDCASAFQRDFLVSVLRAAPPPAERLRLHLPAAEPATGRFREPLAASGGRSLRALLMPVRIAA